MTSATEASVSRPVADLEDDSLLGSFPEGLRLIGSRCDACGCAMIGSRVVCSSCIGRSITRVALPRYGVLYTFTRIHLGSEAAGRVIGYVDLDNGVRTLADIIEGTAPLQPDVRVELGVDGDAWFFSPIEGGEREENFE